MDGLILTLLILDVMDAVMGAHGRGPAVVQGPTVIDALVQGLLHPFGDLGGAGREPKLEDPTGLGHGLALQVPTEAAALVDESHLLESQPPMK